MMTVLGRAEPPALPETPVLVLSLPKLVSPPLVAPELPCPMWPCQVPLTGAAPFHSSQTDTKPSLTIRHLSKET